MWWLNGGVDFLPTCLTDRSSISALAAAVQRASQPASDEGGEGMGWDGMVWYDKCYWEIPAE